MVRRKGKRVRNKDGNLVRILAIGHHTCIRCIKKCRSIKGLGYPCKLLTSTISYGTQEYDSIHFYHDKKQFMNAMEEIGDTVDIVEVNNEPNNMTVWAHEAKLANGFNYKIAHDWHDLDSVRINTAGKDEIKVFRLADGFVFVSDPCERLSKELYDFKQPSVVFSHYCNKEWKGYENYKPGKEDIDGRSGIVYQGGLNPPDHLLNPQAKRIFRYRSMYNLFKEAIANGNGLTIFAGNPDGYQSHIDIGATVHPPTYYDELMKNMQKFKWGWMLFGDKKDPQTKHTTANKWFEYLKVGVVPIVCWAEETARWTEKYGCGIVLDDPKELGNIEKNFGDQYPKLKKRVDEINESGELDSENHIHIIESLWGKVMKGE